MNPLIAPTAPPRPNHRTAALRLCAALRRKGVDTAGLAAGIGLPAALESAPHAQVSGQQMILLLKAAAAALNDEFFGLTARRLKPGSFNFMFEIGLRCETLEALIEQCARFMHVVSDDLEVALVRRQDDAALCLRLQRPELDPDHFLIDHLLLFWHRVLSWAVGYLLPVTRVDLSAGDAPSSERLSYWLCGHWDAGQPVDAFHFHGRYLTLPVVRTPLEWQAQLLQGASGQPEWPRGEQRWSLRLKALLKTGLRQHQAPPSLEAAAAALAIGTQTLRRHLRDEGTAYQQVLDELRRDEAIEKLHVQHLSVADVAEQLGFSEARSFSRAFKQWTGVPPSRYAG
jgi:AraC-like DNA-binding protein